uniref:ABC transporter permease n=1 Tax=Paenirhodobacter enshiensis TaxID=1105367 RepID=UPI0035B2BE3C
MAAVPALWLGAVFVVPLVLTVAVSFLGSSFAGIEYRLTLDNYRQAASGFYLAVFGRTLLFAAMGSALCVALAYPVALFIAGLPERWRLRALVPVLIPYFASFLIRVMALGMVMSRGGLAEAALNALHLHRGALDVLNSPAAVFIGMVYVYLPIAVVPILVVLERVPPALTEASRDLGAGPLRSFLTVTLPLSRPGIATAVLLTAVPMMGEMILPDLLGGGRGLLMGKALSSQYLEAQNYPLGSAMAVLVLAAVGGIVALLARATRGFDGGRP